MPADQAIPVYTSLNDVFGSLGTSLRNIQRWNELAEEFQKRFGHKPTYITRAPGRINLIGEHIDYSLFGVLPAAIERDILIACGPRTVGQPISDAAVDQCAGSVIADNINQKYTRQVFAPSPNTVGAGCEGTTRIEGWYLDINTKELRWESYVKAGYYGVLDNYFTPANVSTGRAHNDGKTSPVPVDLLVTGSVPAGSGLSSSAAIVVASTLAFLAVNGKLDDGADDTPLITRGELVKMSMENEKRVVTGVNSGGMDQAASVMSDAASALYITFYPDLKASPVPLPPRAVFVCANSLVVSDKAVTAKRCYNLRVVETLVAARVLARYLGVEMGTKERITLRHVVGRFAGEKPGQDIGIDRLMHALRETEAKLDILRPKQAADSRSGVTLEEMTKMSGLPPEVFHEVYLSWIDVEATHFELYKRTQHVISEALRVLAFRQICLEEQSVPDTDGVVYLEKMGQLMNESQHSCAELFDCSCPELDRLTELARQAGAFGSRLTGAGWGGCTVSLVAENKVEDFVQKIRDTYPPYQGLEGEPLSEVIFATRPSRGACVYKLD